MSDDKSQLDQLFSTLKQQRDQLAVQIELGKAEAKDEWDKVTAKLDQLSQDYEPVKDAVGSSAESVFEALKLVAEEVQEGFQRVRKSL